MRDYEIMLILPAEADESVVGGVVERITKVIETTGGKVGNIDRWGKRRFAFEIDDKNEGYYVVAKFTAEPPTQNQYSWLLVRHNSSQKNRKAWKATRHETKVSTREVIQRKVSQNRTKPCSLIEVAHR